MRALLVASLEPGAGKTGVAAALAQRFAYEGRRVLALRLGDVADADATADAAFFATLPGARGRGGLPVAPGSVEATIASLAGDATPIVEGDAGTQLNQQAAALDAAVIGVHRGAPDDDAVMQWQNNALALGERFLGLVLTALPPNALQAAQSQMDEAALLVLALLPEDRVLYAPTLKEIAEGLAADLLLGEDSETAVIDEVMIGPVTSDPGQPYYARHGNKAVVTRSDKTDLQLAAMQTNTDCLILTGGFAPSPYTLDRAASEEIAVLLTRGNTPATVERLGGMFGHTRFSSERKLERLSELARERLDYEAIRAALA
jgi:BioD-like phosphotransacetylase family protein